MPYQKVSRNVIIALLLFSSILVPVHAEPLLIDGTGIFLTTGGSWDFYQGYVLTVKSVNLEQRQVWIELLHEDEVLKEGILKEGETLVYSKDEEILNITVDTIYINPEGELITFKPVYQYQDSELPEPVIDEEDTTDIDNEDQTPDGDDTGKQADGFTILQAVACVSVIAACRQFLIR